MILFPHTKREEAFVSSERIRDAVDKTLFQVDNQEIWKTLSMGIADFTGDKTPNINALLELVDKALNQSKRDGKNQTTVWVE